MVRLILTLEQRLQIAALSRASVRQRAIAVHLHLDVRHVRREQRRASLPILSNGLAQNVVDKIIALTAEGLPQLAIARRLNIDPQSVRKYQRRAIQQKGAA